MKSKTKKILGAFIALGLLGSFIPEDESTSTKESSVVKESVKTVEEETVKKDANMPLVSAWDGVASSIKTYLKSNLNDPKSLEIVEKSYMFKINDNLWAQRVKYRARNSFGGMVLEEYVFTIMGNKSNSSVVALDSQEDFFNALAESGTSIINTYDMYGKEVE